MHLNGRRMTDHLRTHLAFICARAQKTAARRAHKKIICTHSFAIICAHTIRSSAHTGGIIGVGVGWGVGGLIGVGSGWHGLCSNLDVCKHNKKRCTFPPFRPRLCILHIHAVAAGRFMALQHQRGRAAWRLSPPEAACTDEHSACTGRVQTRAKTRVQTNH